MKEKGPATVNVQKVIAEDTRSLETGVKENNYWLYNLQNKYYYNEDPKTILEDPVIVKKLTVDRAKEMANKYFNPDNMAKLVLMPENL